MHNDNLHKISEYLLPLSPFVFKVTPICVASCISASNTSRNVPNLTKRKKKHLKYYKQQYTQVLNSSLREPNYFIPRFKKYNLHVPSVGHV